MGDVDKLDITFSDGSRLVCSGSLAETSVGDLRANDDGEFVELRKSVQFLIMEGRLCDHRNGGEWRDLEPGLYLINDQGLWLHV